MIVTLDYETFYAPAQKYSLTNMSVVDYLFDPRYETIMCARKIGSGKTECKIGHRSVAHMIDSVDWPNAAMLSHNAQFDASILYWKYGHVAGLYLDTVAMARALTHAHIGRSSLAKVAEYLGLPPKGTEVVNAANKTLSMFTSQELYEYMRYCKHDCDLAYQIFQRFIRVFPKEELSLIDQTVRMFVEPQVTLNPTKLSAYSFQLKAEMDATLSRVAGMHFPVQATKKSRDPVKEIFSSNPKFAAILEDLGVEVPTKISPTTGQLTWALAKNDRGFKELCDDASQPPEVQAVLAARLGVKSTIDQTRTDKLLNLSQANWPAQFGGPGAAWMPAPLSYGGAHTLRWSGSGGFNLQNLRRGSPIRDAIEAPAGMRIVHRDSSQIEARMVCWLARAMKLLMAFAQKRDVYSEFATGFYRRLITKKDKGERFVGKTCLAAGTRVLTHLGVVPIEQVQKHHMLWDGVEWVHHDGLTAHGPKETLTLFGVSLTPDHGVWCGTRMIDASLVASDMAYQQSALVAGNSQLLHMFSQSMVGYNRSLSNAIAANGSIQLTGQIFAHSAAQDAMSARNRRRLKSVIGNTPRLCLTMHTGLACSIALLPLSVDVTSKLTRGITNTEHAALRFAGNGEKTEQLFSNMSRRVKVGITQFWKWIVEITIKDTNPTILGSFPDNTTATISEPSRSLKPVFDLLNAGLRRRFTIITDAGPVIVSNSVLGLGYGAGVPKFRHMLFIGNGGVAMNVDMEEAKRVVNYYRFDFAKEVPKLWHALDDVLERMCMMNAPAQYSDDGSMMTNYPAYNMGSISSQLWALGKVFDVTAEGAWFPDGLAIQYPKLRKHTWVDDAGMTKTKVIYNDPYGGVKSLWGGSFLENISQRLACIVIKEAMKRIYHETKYHPFLTTHDSLDYCVPVEDVQWWDAYLEAEFERRPTWAPDLPLASEGGWGKTLLAAEDEHHLHHNQ